ncbi:MAG: M48 family metallopeptidase [Anaerolineae bacterium]|nr:M48 family metallopeptidase [Anaerolineae bacterium]
MTIQANQIIRTRRKSIAIIIEPGGRVVVRAPLYATDHQIAQFLALKADWVQAAVDKMRRLPPRQPKKRYRAGEEFLLLGETLRLKIVEGGRSAVTRQGGYLCLRRDFQPRAKAALTAWYRQQARRVLTERVEHFARRHGFTYSKVRISSARTRWGSCSTLGTLSFTWRLVMAPLEVIDYVVVHELVHTRVRNHSKGFWAAVAVLMPDYKARRAWLKQHGAALTVE